MVNHPNRKRKIAEGAAFHEGEWVHVYNQKFSGEPIYEGRACIVGPGDVGDQYRVRFDGERQTVLRFVWPGEPQEDELAWIKKLHAEWSEPGRE